MVSNLPFVDAVICSVHLISVSYNQHGKLRSVVLIQAFHNIHPGADLFNNINLQFWEYWLPGAVAWGYIACTGTNFAIRARPLAHCKFFPTVRFPTLLFTVNVAQITCKQSLAYPQGPQS